MASEDTETNAEAYVDRTFLVQVIGDEARIRILEVLLSEADNDINPTRICELAGINSSSFHNHIDELRRWGLVKKPRMAGNSPMYQINKDNEAAKSIAKFCWDLIDHSIEKRKRASWTRIVGPSSPMNSPIQATADCDSPGRMSLSKVDIAVVSLIRL